MINENLFPDGTNVTICISDAEGKVVYGLPIPGRADLTWHFDADNHIVLDFDEQLYIDAWKSIQGLEKDHSEEEHTEPKTARRTKKNAGEVSEIPNMIAVPSTPDTQYALTTVQNNNAYMELIKPLTKLTFEKGMLYFDGVPSSCVNLVDFTTKQGIEDIDLPTLRLLYSVILIELAQKFQELSEAAPEEFDRRKRQMQTHVVTLYVPDLLEKMGIDRNAPKPTIRALIAKISQYQNIIGLMPVKVGRTIHHSLWPVMLFEGYDEKTNTVNFSSPYINRFITDTLLSHIRVDKKKVVQRKKNGELLMQVTNSYLIKSTITKERNKRAVEVVFIVCTLIEQAGNNIPHIKASTIISRCPDLKQALEYTQNPNQLLKRVFTKAWQLLKTQTILTEKYKNIKFPDAIPTKSTLDMVFEFPHDGKK